MKRQTIHHLINIFLALPLLVLAVLMVTDAPELLNPWNKSFLGGLWILVWPMLLAGTIIPLNGALLAARRTGNPQTPASTLARNPDETDSEQPTTSANKCMHHDREIAPLRFAIPGR